MEALRRQTHTGWPCGAEDFAERLEGLLERVLLYLQQMVFLSRQWGEG